jgi:hypothetical protein
MNQLLLRKIFLPVFAGIFSFFQLQAQSPGTIVTPMNGNGVTILNPNGDRYSSKTSAGFSPNDITESEIPYKVVPPIIAEGAGDNATGATGGFTDIISALDGSGFYSYFDGTNILFRLRMGGTNNGAKAYSVLLDTDMKFGGTGQYADPNYIAPGIGTKNGNPGFEYEVVFSSQFNVTVLNIDGTTTGSVVATYLLKTHSQISVALSRNGGDADYFYDWGVPASTIGSPAQIRFVATTQISPHPAISGHVSDTYGTPDDSGSSVADRWGDIIESQCGFSTGMLGGSSPLCETCTNAPTINPITVTGNNVAITGNWVSLHASKPNTATISLYRNGTLVGTTSATSGMGWSITLPTIYSNDVFTAKAKATDESECLASPPVLSGCTIRPAAPAIICAGRKGIEGTLPLGAEVIIYQVTSTGRTLMNAGLIYTNNAADRKFDFHGTTSQTGAACQGNVNDVADGTYELITSLNGCYSQPVFICVTGANSYTTPTTNTITLNTPILSKHTSVTGTGATVGEVIRLYRNGYLQATQTAGATSFTFSGLTLFQFDELKVYSQSTAAASCMTTSNAFTVTCVTEPPAIDANARGEVLSSATSISGTADPGTTIRLYKGSISSSTLVNTTVVTSTGTWSVGGLTLIPEDTYFATCTNGCESAASRIVVVKGPTTVCPTITGSYTETSTLISGTMPADFTGKIRLYLDGALIDSVSITSATTWSIIVNTSNYNKMFAYGVLRATAEGVNLAEGPVCSTVQIQCVPPALPDVTPTSVSINVGQSASFTISNPVDTLLYSIWDTYGNNYASSKFGLGTGTLNLPSYIFNTAGTYNLIIVADKLTGASCYSSRSVTVVVQHSTLATKFISLAAVKTGQQVRLNWKVSNEENIRHYRVERSLDGISFEAIATVPFQPSAQAVNSYTALDNSWMPSAKLYYRITAVTTGGHLYSHVTSVGGAAETKIQIVPNPVQSTAKLYIESKEEQMATAELTDLQGKILLVKKLYLYEGANMVGVDGLEKFPGGNYILRVSTKTGQQHLRLVIQ